MSRSSDGSPRALRFPAYIVRVSGWIRRISAVLGGSPPERTRPLLVIGGPYGLVIW